MEHSSVLERLCRVCGKAVCTKSAKVKHLCSEYSDELMTVFGISTNDDDPSVHPQHFCHQCQLTIHKAKTKRDYNHQTVPFNRWCSHVEGSCCVCEHYSRLHKAGRPKKLQRTGRPPAVSVKYCIQRVIDVAPKSQVQPGITTCSFQDHQILDPSQLQCRICSDILNSPIELVTCGSVVCAECFIERLQHSKQLTCPCCSTSHIEDFTTIRPASQLTQSMLSRLCVVCEKCQSHLRLDKLKEHVSNSCSTHSEEVPPSVSVEHILNRPSTAPLTPVEQKLQTSLVKRSLSTSPEERILRVKTRGQVYTYMYM